MKGTKCLCNYNVPNPECAYFFFICERRSKPGEETIGGVAFIGQGSPVKQGDEDDGIVSRREMRR